MRTIIIEDETNVRKGFIKMLEKFCPEIVIIGEANDVDSGVALIKKSEFDLLFLDINLPDGTGFELLNKIGDFSFSVIFVTAYDHYAVDAFKISASDYLMKPVSPLDLKKSIDVVKNNLRSTSSFEVLNQRLNTKYDQREKIIIKNSETIDIIKILDILYCQADGSYTKLILLDGSELLASFHLKEYERILQPYGFERAHHSYLVNLEHVESIIKSESYIKLINEIRIPLSQRKKADLISSIEKRYLN